MLPGAYSKLLRFAEAPVFPEDSAKDVIVKLIERRLPEPKGIGGFVRNLAPPAIDRGFEILGSEQGIAHHVPAAIVAGIPLNEE